jgi:hypothetical protein
MPFFDLSVVLLFFIFLNSSFRFALYRRLFILALTIFFVRFPGVFFLKMSVDYLLVGAHTIK